MPPDMVCKESLGIRLIRYGANVFFIKVEYAFKVTAG